MIFLFFGWLLNINLEKIRILEMKKQFIILLTLLCCVMYGQQVGIGTTTPHLSAILDITSTNKGLLIPRMTEAQRNAIASPADGLIIYNTTSNCVNFRKAGVWEDTCKPKVTLTITTQPTAALNYVCDGNSNRVLTVVANASNNAALTYQWLLNGNAINGWSGIAGENTSTLTLPETTVNISGTYSVRVSALGVGAVTSNPVTFSWVVSNTVNTTRLIPERTSRVSYDANVADNNKSTIQYLGSSDSCFRQSPYAGELCYCPCGAADCNGPTRQANIQYKTKDNRGCWGPAGWQTVSWSVRQ